MGEKSFNLHKNDTKSTQNPIRWKPLETYRPMCQLTSWRNKNDIRPFQHQSSRKLNSISNWCPNKHGCSSKERWSRHGTTNVRQRTLSNPWSHTHHTKKTGHLAFIIKWKVYWLCQNMSCLCWTCVRCCRHLFKHVLVGRANCTCGQCVLFDPTNILLERTTVAYQTSVCFCRKDPTGTFAFHNPNKTFSAAARRKLTYH